MDKKFPKEVIILAGGKGTRLKSVVKDIPKPMAPVANRPFLAFILDYLAQYPIEHVVLSVGYRWDAIKEYFGQTYKGIRLSYAVEKIPLGTGGGIKLAAEFCSSEDIFVLNGDTLFDVNLMSMWKALNFNSLTLGIGVKKMFEFDRYGTLSFDNQGYITHFFEKQYRSQGWINGGVYLLNRQYLFDLPLPEKFSFEKEILEKRFAQDRFRIFSETTSAYFIDIGIPTDYDKAQSEVPKLLARS